jgi:hypothetical protein
VPQDIVWLESRVGTITVPLLNKIGKLDEWLEAYHGANITVNRTDDGKVLLSLTADGAEKYVPESLHQGAMANDVGVTPTQMAVELRGNVFEELRLEAEKRRASGGLFTAKSQVNQK